jgi:hypothetical protein
VARLNTPFRKNPEKYFLRSTPASGIAGPQKLVRLIADKASGIYQMPGKQIFSMPGYSRIVRM